MAHSHCHPCRYEVLHFELELFDGAGFNAWLHDCELIRIGGSGGSDGFAEECNVFLFVGLGKVIRSTLFPEIQLVDHILQLLDKLLEFLMGLLHHLQDHAIVPFIVGIQPVCQVFVSHFVSFSLACQLNQFLPPNIEIFH